LLSAHLEIWCPSAGIYLSAYLEFPLSAVIEAARRFSLAEQFIEKDYFVTEALRILRLRHGCFARITASSCQQRGGGLNWWPTV
jgi:hypothetical protein